MIPYPQNVWNQKGQYYFMSTNTWRPYILHAIVFWRPGKIGKCRVWARVNESRDFFFHEILELKFQVLILFTVNMSIYKNSKNIIVNIFILTVFNASLIILYFLSFCFVGLFNSKIMKVMNILTRIIYLFRKSRGKLKMEFRGNHENKYILRCILIGVSIW